MFGQATYRLTDTIGLTGGLRYTKDTKFENNGRTIITPTTGVPTIGQSMTVELRSGGQVLAALDTLLEPDDDGEARQLVRDIAGGLASGELEPTAASIEPLADRGG